MSTATLRSRSHRIRRLLACLTMLAGAMTFLPVAASTSPVPSARVSGPISGGLHGRPFDSTLIPLAPWRYVEHEYFVSGTATGGGRWPFSPLPSPSLGNGPAPYQTRIVVRRPLDRARFNGTVLAEWLNVTSSQDLDADWSEGYREILRGGYAYVGVSVQPEGVQSLKLWDPVRYGSLQQPGDGYDESILAQVLQAVRHPNGVDPLAGLSVRRIIAAGHSQSGVGLHYFVDDVQSTTPVADGFLIRGDATSNLDFGRLRTPVLEYQSETEIAGPIGRLQERGTYTPPAPDSPFFRLWQVAGSTHTGMQGTDYFIDELRRDYFRQTITWDEGAEGRFDGAGGRTCPSSIGVGPLDQFPQWYALDAAIHGLNRWIITGRPPAPAPRIVASGAGAIQRDKYGNALGGIREPVVDVPIATYHGDEGCPLAGVSVALSASTLTTLYPTRARYVDALRAAADRAQAAGWLLGYDRSDLLARAAR
ncbi:MAG: alpha/beta hydrolase domain-containing protein [Actinomycetota bacterium]